MGIAELHGQLASLELMIRHMELFAHDGAKYIGTEAFQTFEQPDLNRFFDTGIVSPLLHNKIRKLNLDAGLYYARPNINQLEPHEIIDRWMERDPSLGAATLHYLDGLEGRVANHPFSFRPMMEKARESSIRIWGFNRGADNLATRLEDLNGAVARDFETIAAHGKIVFHAGGAHLKSLEEAPGICDLTRTPAVGVYDGASQHVRVVPNGKIRLTLYPDYHPIPHDYVIQGKPMPVTGIAYPSHVASEFEVVDPATHQRFPANIHETVGLNESPKRFL